jgi:hypothetical protein
MKVRNGVAYRKFHAKPCSFIKRRKESTFYLCFFRLPVWWSWNIVVGVVSTPWVRRFCIRIAGNSYRFISVPGRPYQLWGPPSFLFSGYRGYYRGVNRPGVKLTTHLHLVLRWRMNGAVPLLHPMRIRDTERGKLYLSTLFIWRCPTRHYRKILDPYRQISQFGLLTFFPPKTQNFLVKSNTNCVATQIFA